MKIIIFGAGYPTIVSLIEDIVADGKKMEILGFAVDDESQIGTTYLDFPILGKLENIPITNDTFIINNIGSTTFARKAIDDRIYKIKSHIPTLIHPTVERRRSLISEEGCIIMNEVFIGPRSKIGNSVVLRNRVLLGHDNVIGNGVFISVHSIVMGYANIGNYSYVGGNASILPRIKVLDNSIIGAAAVITKDVPENEIWVGNPGKYLKKNEKIVHDTF